jgi:Ser-tRNA(Ala) deacylase AlaX
MCACYVEPAPKELALMFLEVRFLACPLFPSICCSGEHVQMSLGFGHVKL